MSPTRSPLSHPGGDDETQTSMSHLPHFTTGPHRTPSQMTNLTLYSIDTQFDATSQFENIVKKEENAHNEQFLLFPQCFLLNQIIISSFVHIFDIISFFATEIEEPKIGI